MRKSGASVAGLVIIVILVAATLWLGVAALIKNGEYRREAAVTNTPSVAPGRADITENPAFPTSTPTPCILRLNSVGIEVRDMQQRLAGLGYYAGDMDGQFGTGTQGAVVMFQTQHGIRADGIAGDETLQLLYSAQAQFFVPTPTPSPTPPMMASGDTGEDVKTLQTRLQDLGFYEGALDGDFGKGTKAAVKLFQQQHGLDADGIAGQKTLAALYSDQARRVVVTPTPETILVLADSMPLLVNKEHPVAADFVPADLVNVADVVDGGLLKVKYSGTKGVREAAEALRDMLLAAKADGVTNWQLSAGYRSIQDQQDIFDSFVKQAMNDGKSRQNAIAVTRLTVADPGASEHHTGLAFDMTVPGTENFVSTKQCAWLHKHCWDYGFIVRYTDDKEEITGFMGEEWHIRYVGTEHSLTIRDKDWCLEEYLRYAAI